MPRLLQLFLLDWQRHAHIYLCISFPPQMASNPNDGGFICPPRLIELAGSTGYLKSDEGGEELRQYYDASV